MLHMAPLFVSRGPACSRYPEASGYPNPDLDWPASCPLEAIWSPCSKLCWGGGEGLSGKVNWLFRSTAYKFRLCGLRVSAANGQGNILGSTKNREHPEQTPLVRRYREGEKQDGFLAVVSPRTALTTPVLLEAHKPVLLRVLLGRVSVIMVFF